MQKDTLEKSSVMMVEDINDDLKKHDDVKKDYSGVAEKTDPAEIALVKKLDRWIMPMLWTMYWLKYGLPPFLFHLTPLPVLYTDELC